MQAPHRLTWVASGFSQRNVPYGFPVRQTVSIERDTEAPLSPPLHLFTQTDYRNRVLPTKAANR
jgi:hypothetical protein